MMSNCYFLCHFHAGTDSTSKVTEQCPTWTLQCSPAGSFSCFSVQLSPRVYPLTSPFMWNGQSVTSVWQSTPPSAQGFATQGYVCAQERKNSRTNLKSWNKIKLRTDHSKSGLSYQMLVFALHMYFF